MTAPPSRFWRTVGPCRLKSSSKSQLDEQRLLFFDDKLNLQVDTSPSIDSVCVEMADNAMMLGHEANLSLSLAELVPNFQVEINTLGQ